MALLELHLRRQGDRRKIFLMLLLLLLSLSATAALLLEA